MVKRKKKKKKSGLSKVDALRSRYTVFKFKEARNSGEALDVFSPSFLSTKAQEHLSNNRKHRVIRMQNAIVCRSCDFLMRSY